MFRGLKKKLRRFSLRRLGLWEGISFGRVSYAQEGEDVLLWRIIGRQRKEPGVYIEVGSNHPWKCSNTAFFYQLGWKGVAIDPNPDFAALFARERPRDVFLNVGVGDEAGELLYHRFTESLFNTFSVEQAAALAARGISQAGTPVPVEIMRLRDALARIWPEGKKIDLLSIDAEGMDECVIRGHDFERYPADNVIVEFDYPVLEPGREPPVVAMLRDRDYVFVAKLFKSALFMHRSEARRMGMIS